MVKTKTYHSAIELKLKEEHMLSAPSLSKELVIEHGMILYCLIT